MIPERVGMKRGFTLIVSLSLYLLHTVSDGVLTLQYYYFGYTLLSSVTASISVFGLFMTQLLSFLFMKKKDCTILKGTLHILMLQPLARYVQLMVTGLEARHLRSNEALRKFREQLLVLWRLRFCQVGLQNTTQCSLQLYVLLFTSHATHMTAACMALHLLVISWSYAIYSPTMYQSDTEPTHPSELGLVRQLLKNNNSVKVSSAPDKETCSEVFFKTTWRLFMFLSRLLAIVMAVRLCDYWTVLMIGVHWIVMSLWVMLQTPKPPFVRQQHVFWGFVIGLLYCFTYTGFQRTESWPRCLLFHFVMLAQAGSVVVTWCLLLHVDSLLEIAVPAACVTCYILGLLVMVVYFRLSMHSDGYSPEAATHETSAPGNQARLIPRFSSTSFVSRTRLFKSSRAQLPPLNFKEFNTPSQLTPVACRTPHMHHIPSNTETPNIFLGDSAFKHYSINTSHCMNTSTPVSRCVTKLNFRSEEQLAPSSEVLESHYYTKSSEHLNTEPPREAP